MWAILTMLAIFKTCACKTSEFKSYPTTVKAPENDTVLLPCYLQTSSDGSNFPVKIRWYKDDVLLVDSGDSTSILPERFTLWGNGSLQVIKIEPDDTAKYTCEIVRPLPWSTIKQVHAIEVLHSPIVIPDPLNGILKVKIGEIVRMSCKPEGVPYPIINWYSKGKELKLLDYREMLKFRAANKSLSGTYTCVARNGVGEPASANIELIITYAPELTTSRPWIHTAPGLRVEMDCEISADPPATVKWFKNGVQVSLDKRTIALDEGKKHKLYIRNVTIGDFGNYTCKAYNSIGENTLRIEVTGAANPAVFKTVDQSNINTKSSYKLVWEVDSYVPIIEYNLCFKPQNIGNAWKELYIPAEPSTGTTHSKSYTIEGLGENTIYEAFIFSRNRFGRSQPSKLFTFVTDKGEVEEDVIKGTTSVENEVFPTVLPNAQDFAHNNFIYFVFITVINMLIK